MQAKNQQSTNTWYPGDWTKLHALQIPEYDINALQAAKRKLNNYQPLVSFESIHKLIQDLQQVLQGEGFILHAGDCAEAFSDTSPHIVRSKLMNLSELAKETERLIGKKVLCICRQAGQFAKPRTNVFEESENGRILAYRGDLINSIIATKEARTPDPKRMLQGYRHAQRILNYFEDIQAHAGPMYFSHEALLLHFEECMTKLDAAQEWFNVSTHLLWLGVRTAFDSPAHIRYASGIENPLALKFGPSNSFEALSNLLEQFSKKVEAGKLLIIYRFGCDQIANLLPNLLNLLKTKRCRVLLLCDPMHGNTKSNGQYKTRHPSDILREIMLAMKIHSELNVPLHGIHLETSFEDIDECVELGEQSQHYKSLVDPRLNRKQSSQLLKTLLMESVL